MGIQSFIVVVLLAIPMGCWVYFPYQYIFENIDHRSLYKGPLDVSTNEKMADCLGTCIAANSSCRMIVFSRNTSTQTVYCSMMYISNTCPSGGCAPFTKDEFLYNSTIVISRGGDCKWYFEYRAARNGSYGALV